MEDDNETKVFLKHVAITAIAFILLSLLNIPACIYRDNFEFSGSIPSYSDTFPFTGFFCLLYFSSVTFLEKLPMPYRWPLTRSVLYTLLLSTELFTDPGPNDPFSYVLFLGNCGLCSFWAPFNALFHERFTMHPVVFEFLVNIILFGIYEIIILKTADRIYHKIKINL
jgi:hypothetical protein